MNEAAEIVLYCRGALDGEAWKIAADSDVWSQMRSKILRSLDAEMARMLIMLTSGQYLESREILADLKLMKAEVQKATERHNQVAGVLTGEGSGLRQTLAEMKELQSADEEYLQDRLSH